MAVTRQWLDKHVSTATDMRTKRGDLLEAVFSMQFVVRLYSEGYQELLGVAVMNYLQASCHPARILRGSRGVSIVQSHYQAMTCEDMEYLMRTAVQDLLSA